MIVVQRKGSEALQAELKVINLEEGLLDREVVLSFPGQCHIVERRV